MDIGLFMVPFRAPQTSLKDGYEWDMQVIRWADEFGLSEVWVAEHSTMRWEPVCSPELYLRQRWRKPSRSSSPPAPTCRRTTTRLPWLTG